MPAQQLEEAKNERRGITTKTCVHFCRTHKTVQWRTIENAQSDSNVRATAGYVNRIIEGKEYASGRCCPTRLINQSASCIALKPLFILVTRAVPERS